MIGDYMAATKCPDPCVMSRNGNTTEMKTDIATFISFRFKLFRFRFVSVFRNFFVSVFVSVNGINFFPLTDISVSVSVNVNHTETANDGEEMTVYSTHECWQFQLSCCCSSSCHLLNYCCHMYSLVTNSREKVIRVHLRKQPEFFGTVLHNC